MKQESVILFDLDGTLTDPKVGITQSVAYALRGMGIAVPCLDELCKFIGPPLRGAFQEYYGMSEEEAERATALYREYFARSGLFENMIYPETQALLQELEKQGNVLVLATSKPTVFAKKILEHFDLSRYFRFVAGCELDGTRGTKGEVIAYALGEIGVTDKRCAVMVGDREHDILGAKEAGIASFGVLYGYGSRAELERAGADRIAASMEELRVLLRGWGNEPSSVDSL